MFESGRERAEYFWGSVQGGISSLLVLEYKGRTIKSFAEEEEAI
jgi:hypothetical protein